MLLLVRPSIWQSIFELCTSVRRTSSALSVISRSVLVPTPHATLPRCIQLRPSLDNHYQDTSSAGYPLLSFALFLKGEKALRLDVCPQYCLLYSSCIHVTFILLYFSGAERSMSSILLLFHGQSLMLLLYVSPWFGFYLLPVRFEPSSILTREKLLNVYNLFPCYTVMNSRLLQQTQEQSPKMLPRKLLYLPESASCLEFRGVQDCCSYNCNRFLYP